MGISLGKSGGGGGILENSTDSGDGYTPIIWRYIEFEMRSDEDFFLHLQFCIFRKSLDERCPHTVVS